MSKVNLLIAAILLVMATVTQAAEVVGKVGYMSGSLMVQRADGTIKVIGSKSEVLAGDTLVTAKDSYAQVQMNDGTKMTLRPHSNLKIEEYQFKKEEPKSDNAVFRLLKGGLRTMTGLIGKRGDPDAYKMRAESATIGIRGTDFSSRLCATPNCQDDVAASARNMDKPPVAPLPTGGTIPQPATPAAAPPGLYVTVHNGQVVLAQADMSLSLGRGETGFASPAALVRLPAPPAFMNADTKQTNAIEAKASKSEESKAASKTDKEKTDSKSDKEKADSKSDKEKADSKSDKEKADSKSDKEKADSKSDEEKADSKSDKEKADSKSDKEKADGKSDKEKAGGKPDEEKSDSKSDKEKAGAKQDEKKSDSKSDKGDTSSKSDGKKNNGKPDAEKAVSKPDVVKDSINPEGKNADSPDPTINQSGCVVQ